MKFYIFNPQYGPNGETPVYTSTDGGRKLKEISVPTNYAISLAVSPAAEGDLRLSSYNGLFNPTNSGRSFRQITGMQPSYQIGFGKAAPGATYPTMFVVGQPSGDTTCSQNSPASKADVVNYLTNLSSECVCRSIDA